MTYLYFFGIDVSKDWYDVAEPSGSHARRYANTPEGCAEFIADYRDALGQAFVVMEATGGHERALLTALIAAHVAVHRADPRAAHFFLRSLGRKGKTDHLDARGLARYAAERHQTLALFVLPHHDQQALTMLMMRKADLIAMRTAELNRRQQPVYQELHASLAVMIETIETQIAAIDQRIHDLVTTSPVFKPVFATLDGIKGIGRQTALTLMAFMPELGRLTRRQAASLAGCAPHPRDSGKLNRYRPTTGGRATIKQALFMAALAACRFNPDLARFYARLIANGKPKLVALTAVMRKLITIANAKIRSQINLATG